MDLVKKRYLISIFFLFFLIISSNSVVGSNVSVDPEKKSYSDNLDLKLNELINSSDRELFAEKNNIKYKDGKAEVVIELKQGTDIPNGYNITINQRYTDSQEDLVQAYVSIDNLTNLSQENNVTHIRLPQNLSPTNMENGTETENTENSNDSSTTQTQNSLLLGGILPVLAILSFFVLINKI